MDRHHSAPDTESGDTLILDFPASSTHGLAEELREAAPVERPLFETAEATEGEEDVGVVEEAGEDGNSSPDSILCQCGQSCDITVGKPSLSN